MHKEEAGANDGRKPTKPEMGLIPGKGDSAKGTLQYNSVLKIG